MKKFRVVSLLFTLAIVYILLTSHSIGQATGYNEDDTGSPTANLCTSCHGGGSYGPVTTIIQVFTHGTTTAITSYQPGTLYDVTVTIKPGAGTPAGYGFEFTGLTTPGNIPLSGYSNLASNVKQKTLTTGTWSGRTFTEHNGVTTNNVFAFSWTAPAAGTGTIEFYASGNAVNGDGSDRGDNPSNTSLVVSEALGVSGTTTNVLCFGGNTGAIAVSTIGGTSPYSYNWGSGITSQNRTGLTAGAYTVTVTDNAGNSVSATFTITQPSAALSISATTTNVLCYGNNTGAIQLNPAGGTGPYSYNWAGNITTENRDSLTSGTYFVTVKDNNGCTDTSSYTVLQPAKLIASDSAGTIACFGGTVSIAVNASGGTSPYIGTGNFIVAAGTHNYTVTDANSCTSSITAIIPQPTQLVATAGTITISCSGDSGSIIVSATGGTPPYSDTGSFLVTSPGSYTYTVTDSNGCSASATGTALSSSGLTDTFTTTAPTCHSTCNGSISVFVSGGTMPYSFIWSDSTNRQSDTGLCAGNYQQIITDSTGCSLINNYVVPQVSAIQIEFNSDSIYCFGDSSQISVNVSGGVGPYTYEWSNGQTQKDIEAPANSYSLSVTDSHRCSSSDSLSIYQPKKLLVSGASTNLTCYEFADGGINTTVTGGATPYKFDWSNGSTGMNMTGLFAGEYTVTITDNNSCTTTSTFNISQPDSIVITVISVTNDTGENSGAINVSVSGGTPPYNYSWEDTADIEEGTGLSQLGPGTYTVYIIDSNGCTQALNGIVVIATGITNLQLDGIRLYPNPATDKIFIHLPALNAPVQLQIFSAEGTLIKSIALAAGDSRVDVSNLLPAMYIFEIGAGSGTARYKVLKIE